MKPRLLVIRHCESIGQASDAALSSAGEIQAIELARRLADEPITRIVSSPYRRARDTIGPFAAGRGLTVDIDPRLAERRLSPAPIDHFREVVRRSFRDLDYRLEGCESGRETFTRGWAALHAALDYGAPLTAIVSHGQMISMVFHTIDPRFGYEGWLSLTNPDVYLLERNDDGAWCLVRV